LRTQLVQRFEVLVNDSGAYYVCSMSTFDSTSTSKSVQYMNTHWTSPLIELIGWFYSRIEKLLIEARKKSFKDLKDVIEFLSTTLG